MHEPQDRMSVWLETTQVIARVVEVFRERGVGIAQWKLLLSSPEKVTRIVGLIFEEEIETEALRERHSRFGETVPKEHVLDFLDGLALTSIERVLAHDQLGSIDKILPAFSRIRGWKRAALCLYFGLGSDAVKFDREEISRMLRINLGSVKSWLGSRTSASSFACVLTGNVQSMLDRPQGEPIDVIGLTPQAVSTLISARVLTRQALVTLSEEDLRTKVLDRKLLNEIQAFLRQ